MKHNFGAGPCILPQDVFRQAAEAVLDFNGTGLSILEVSHRSKEFEAVIVELEALVRELLAVPSGYSVFFMQGGASTQFAMAPLNLLPENGRAAYLNTGTWATKAIKEAQRVGNVDVVASGADGNFTRIPTGYTVPEDAAYFHITSNNTIFGTEFVEFPVSPVPLVSDMSSDIFSREIKVSDFGLIYAGAQKNMGPAGAAVVIIKDELIGQSGRRLPAIFDYKSHADAGSMYHTPPVYTLYVSMLNMRWLKERGGVGVIEQENAIKARTLYEEIDRNSLFRGTAEVADRSRMNVTFVTEDSTHEAPFLELAKSRGLVGLKGHRSVGGFRASIYNALGITSVNALVDTMQEFEEQVKKGL